MVQDTAGAVTKITVKIAGYEIELSPEQVRELKTVLSEIYPEPKIVERSAPQIPMYPWHTPAWPSIISKYSTDDSKGHGLKLLPCGTPAGGFQC